MDLQGTKVTTFAEEMYNEFELGTRITGVVDGGAAVTGRSTAFIRECFYRPFKV